MVEVVMHSIRVSLMSQHRIAILKDVDSERFLPIWIGQSEAEAITVALQEIPIVRPLTHDLLRNVLGDLGAEVLRVNIIELRNEIFYARIALRVNGKEMEIDSRPSDAMALADRVHVPIFVAEEVMREAASEGQDLRCIHLLNNSSAPDMSEAIRNGKYVELTYKVTDRKLGHVLTRVEFPLGYVHGHNEILAPSVHRELEGKYRRRRHRSGDRWQPDLQPQGRVSGLFR